MTTPAILMRQRIEAALTGLLGAYTLPGGEVVPAISLGDPPEGTTVQGLECLMAPNPKRDEALSFAYLGAATAYPVRLINNTDDPDVIEIATNALARWFWPFWDEPRLQEATADMPEQSTMSLLYDLTQFLEETP